MRHFFFHFSNVVRKDFLQFVQPNFESIEKSSRFATGEIPNWGSPFGNAT